MEAHIIEEICVESAPCNHESQVLNYKDQEKSIVTCNSIKALETTFKSREDIISSVQNFALAQGHAVSIKKSQKDKFIYLGCDRGGHYRNRHNISMEERKRKAGSRLINCPFEVRGHKKGDGSWSLSVFNASHNHEPSKDMSGHPSRRRLSQEEILRVKEMTQAGIAPRKILSTLKKNNPSMHAISKTVYNMKAKIWSEYLDGRTMIQALLEELGKGGFIYNVKHDSNNHVTHLFFAHPKSILLTKSYSTVFVMDCTYKTNRYKMPLLDIVGVSCFNTSFYSCFAFLQKEEEEDYIWALTMFSNILGVGCHPSVIVSDRELALMNAIRVVFPRTRNLLCIWHIEKNILAKCKPQFKEGEDWDSFLSNWSMVSNSITEAEFEEQLQNFENQYKEKLQVLNYLRTTWLPFKEYFVTAWTNRHLHFGNSVTSRVEGAHSTLKKYFQVSTGNLVEVKNKICLVIENQFQEVKAQLSSEKMRVPHHFCIPFFKELITHVSVFALDKLFKQYDIARTSIELPACKGGFMSTMGLPCAHEMKRMNYEVLQLEMIHPQWRLDIRSFLDSDIIQSNDEDQFKDLLLQLQQKYHEWPISEKEAAHVQISQLINAHNPFLYEPTIAPHKGRPLGSKAKKNTSSTRRDPSAFEIVEKARKCRICNGFGHNSRTCQYRENFESSSQLTTDVHESENSMIDWDDSFLNNNF